MARRPGMAGGGGFDEDRGLVRELRRPAEILVISPKSPPPPPPPPMGARERGLRKRIARLSNIRAKYGDAARVTAADLEALREQLRHLTAEPLEPKPAANATRASHLPGSQRAAFKAISPAGETDPPPPIGPGYSATPPGVSVKDGGVERIVWLDEPILLRNLRVLGYDSRLPIPACVSERAA